MKLNEKYSYKDFSFQNFSGVDAKEFNNTEIIGSCFCQSRNEISDIFPDDMVNVTFINCNLDNVEFDRMERFKSHDNRDYTLLSRNIRFIDCTVSFIKEVEGLAWHCDKDGNPLEKVSTIEEAV